MSNHPSWRSRFWLVVLIIIMYDRRRWKNCSPVIPVLFMITRMRGGGATLLWRHRRCGGGTTYWHKIEVHSYYHSLKILRVCCMTACPTIDPENSWLGDALLTANMDTCGQDLEAWCSRGRPSIIPSPKYGRRSGSILQRCIRELIVLSDLQFSDTYI